MLRIKITLFGRAHPSLIGDREIRHVRAQSPDHPIEGKIIEWTYLCGVSLRIIQVPPTNVSVHSRKPNLFDNSRRAFEFVAPPDTCFGRPTMLIDSQGM
jgi:hypothetical protein